MKTQEIDIAIIGGGLLGMMSAFYLADHGFKISIFDKSEFAGESSWAGGGILTPLYPWRYAEAINDLAFRSQKLYPSLITDIKSLSGIDPQYFNSGMLISSDDIDQQVLDWMISHGVMHHKATVGERVYLSDNDSYMFLPTICQVRNPRFASSLKLALSRKSVTLNEQCSVEGIFPASDESFTLDTAQGRFTAKKVIVSAGAWSGKILKKLDLSLPVKPVRGQMLLFKAKAGVPPAIVLAEGKYIIPRLDGHVLVGSTMEDVGFDKSTTQQALDDLVDFVKARCPELFKFPIVKHWSGLRPASPQGVPFIFEHPEFAGLFVNTGHFRNGIALAPASAELTRDLVLKQRTTLNPEAYQYDKLFSRAIVDIG